MRGALVDAQVAHDLAEERTAREHALHGLLDHALGETALENGLGRALLDAARKPGVVIVHLLIALAAGEDHLVGVDDNDVVAAVDVGRIGGLVLAAQAHRHDRGETAHDEALRVDQNPLLLDLGGLQRSRLHRVDPRCELRSSQALKHKPPRGTRRRVGRGVAGHSHFVNRDKWMTSS